jgi:hypothetical protein
MFAVGQYLTNDEARAAADQAYNIANFDGLWRAGHASDSLFPRKRTEAQRNRRPVPATRTPVMGDPQFGDPTKMDSQGEGFILRITRM